MGEVPRIKMKAAEQEYIIMPEARRIVDLIKDRCLNDRGQIVRLYPQKEGTIYADFDDLVPFFLYFGEDEFIARQIGRASCRERV